MKQGYRLITAVFLSALSFLSSAAEAEKFPVKPITAIAPFGAGGGTDRSVRLFASVWPKYSSTQMRVVNMPGAGSSTGMKFVKDSAADGYTIVQSGSQMLTVPYFFTYEETGWKLEEFEPIGIQQTISFLLVVPTDSPFKTLKDLIEFGRKNPGKISHASVGYGGDSHIAFKALEQVAGFTATVIPFDSGADQVANIAGGHVDAAVSTSGTMLPLVRSGKARVLAVGTPKRVPGLDFPTAKEQGIDWEFINWRGWLAPPNTPKERVNYIAEILRKAVTEDKEVIAKIQNEGEVPDYYGPEEFKKYLEYAKTVYEPAINAIREEEKLRHKK
jgi:tripartite-type tricarboxylate transporter receptor subunit TctC